MLPTTSERVPRHTADSVNREIQNAMDRRVRACADNPDEIDGRLAELDREWDIERTLEANAATLAFTGVVLAATVDRRWLALPALVTGFLLQHALQGWCPPVPVLRRLGFRTMREIDTERSALKALRGDFGSLEANPGDGESRSRRALQAARR